jgi:hypothetical protein
MRKIQIRDARAAVRIPERCQWIAKLWSLDVEDLVQWWKEIGIPGKFASNLKVRLAE